MEVDNNKERKHGKRRNEQVIEAVEIEYIEVSNNEYEKRICALVKALLEIDDGLNGLKIEQQISKEAA